MPASALVRAWPASAMLFPAIVLGSVSGVSAVAHEGSPPLLSDNLSLKLKLSNGF